ncbi:hypothetical protein, partial [Mitsuaria sp. TWR114]
ARPAAQPYVASGLVAKPAWTMPAAGAGASGFGLQLEAVVDTTSAGFRTMPCYSAQVLGRRDFSFDVGDRDVVRLVDGFVMLLAADKAGFKFSMLVPDSLLASLPPGADDPDPQSEDFRKQLLKQVRDEWRIEWIGVEG